MVKPGDMRIKKMIKRILMLFCIIFTVATLISCILNLALGYETDTYVHIIDRAVLTLLGSLVVTLVLELKLRNGLLNFLLPYGIFIILAMLYVFITGFFEELHPNAYRDVFLNDTIAYIVVYACLKIYDKLKLQKDR